MPTLDASQLEFCQSPATNVRLLAPAGCGKTHCLLHRCLHLAKMAHPRRPRFLVVTFTRAARDELKTRLDTDQTFADIRGAVEVTTLNAWGYRRMRNTATSPQLRTTTEQRQYTVWNQLQPVWREYDPIAEALKSNRGRRGTNPSRDLMDTIDGFKSLGFDHERHTSLADFESHWSSITTQGLEWRLSVLTDTLVRLGIIETAKSNERYRPPFRVVWNRFFRFWIEATRLLIDSSTFTLEDQKYYAYLDEQSHLENGSYLSGAASYDHVFVDEFQDINPLDIALVRSIAERNRATLTIVGDDDQAIFEWRGTTPEYILNPGEYFDRHFETYTLAVNYRSPSNIVKHSQLLIAHNTRRVDKSIRSHDNSTVNQAILEIKPFDTLQSSMDYVIQLVHDAIRSRRSPSRIALISKLKGQIIPYQIHFASEGTSFCAAEDLQLFESRAFQRVVDLVSIKDKSWKPQSTRDVVDDILSLCDLAGYYQMSKKNRDSLRFHLTNKRPRSVNAAISFLAENKKSDPIGALKPT